MLQVFSQKVLNQLHKVIVFHYLNNNLEISTLQNYHVKLVTFSQYLLNSANFVMPDSLIKILY